jgi:hypothetical protein
MASGREEPTIQGEDSPILMSQVQDLEGSRLQGRMVMQDKKFLICMNIGNSANVIERWWNGIHGQTYPKKNISIHLIEDQTNDGTLHYLRYLRSRYGPEYNSFIIDRAIDLPMYSGMRCHPTLRWTYRVDEWVKWHDMIWFPYAIDGRVDYVTFIQSDVIAHPNMLERHFELLNNMPQCGWIGSIGTRKGMPVINAWKWIVPNPIDQYNRCFATGGHIIQPNGTYPNFVSLVAGMNKGEEKGKPDPFECAFVGSCFTLRGLVLKKGATMKHWPQEAAVPFVVEMNKAGYKAYCDKQTPMIHMSYDGTEYPYIP